jgi:putative transposase
MKIEKQDTKLSNFWSRIPVYEKSIWVAIQFPNNQEELLSYSIRETKLIKKSENWFLLITVQKDMKLRKKYDRILAVDLGEKHIATSVEFADGSMTNLRFYGKEIRGIRRHYAWLRKRLGEKKLLKKIKQIGNTEKCKVNDCLHKISRQIVNEAKKSNSIIVLGDLKGIRNQKKGRRMNRIVSSMPYLKLTKYIEYKANWEEIEVIRINERGTSHTCHRCNSEGKRLTQGLFKCLNCNLEYNADLNGCINIAKRFFEQSLKDGASLITPITQKCEVR